MPEYLIKKKQPTSLYLSHWSIKSNDLLKDPLLKKSLEAAFDVFNVFGLTNFSGLAMCVNFYQNFSRENLLELLLRLL